MQLRNNEESSILGMPIVIVKLAAFYDYFLEFEVLIGVNARFETRPTFRIHDKK